jgi:hypothetical protein
VVGQYPQIRKLIAAIQSSPEFLVVEQIAFTGDEGTTTQDLKVSVRVATYLSEADRETLDRLTGGIRDAAAAGGEPPPAEAPGQGPAAAGEGLSADSEVLSAEGEAQPIGGGDAEAGG